MNHVVTRAIIITDEKVLLGKRARGRGINQYALIGGKPEQKETPEEAIVREVKEELGINLTNVKPWKTEIDKKSVPGESWDVYYFTGTLEGVPTLREDEILDILYVDIENLARIDIAFDHREILMEYFRSCRREKLLRLGLNQDNCVVIGSGIMEALGIRKSGDIDAVVTQGVYEKIKDSKSLSPTQNHGREILAGNLMEIGTEWNVLDKPYRYVDLVNESTVIDSVRYNSLDFLLKVKRSWVNNKTSRPKDDADIDLIESYLKNN